MPPKVYNFSPSTGLKSDIKRLMNDFIAAKTVRFEEFSEIWKKRKFSFLCAGRQTDREAREFLERAFLIAEDYFLPPYQFQVRVGGLYLIYGIYMTQPLAPKVKIRLTVNQWEETLQFQKEAIQQNHLDVVYVFNKMLAEQAFQFCYTPSEMGSRMINLESEDNEINLADEMKEERREINRLFNYESMEQLSYLLDHYHVMKVNLAGPKATKPDKSLDVVEGSFVENLVGILQMFKESVANIYKHGTPLGISGTSKGSENTGSGENILSRRQALKARSFAAGASPKSPRKHMDNSEGSSHLPKTPQRLSRSSEEKDDLETFLSSSQSKKRKVRLRKNSLKKYVSQTKSEIPSKSTAKNSSCDSLILSIANIPPPSLQQATQDDLKKGTLEVECFGSLGISSKQSKDLVSQLEEPKASSENKSRNSVSTKTRRRSRKTKKLSNSEENSPSMSPIKKRKRDPAQSENSSPKPKKRGRKPSVKTTVYKKSKMKQSNISPSKSAKLTESELAEEDSNTNAERRKTLSPKKNAKNNEVIDLDFNDDEEKNRKRMPGKKSEHQTRKVKVVRDQESEEDEEVIPRKRRKQPANRKRMSINSKTEDTEPKKVDSSHYIRTPEAEISNGMKISILPFSPLTLSNIKACSKSENHKGSPGKAICAGSISPNKESPKTKSPVKLSMPNYARIDIASPKSPVNSVIQTNPRAIRVSTTPMKSTITCNTSANKESPKSPLKSVQSDSAKVNKGSSRVPVKSPSKSNPPESPIANDKPLNTPGKSVTPFNIKVDKASCRKVGKTKANESPKVPVETTSGKNAEPQRISKRSNSETKKKAETNEATCSSFEVEDLPQEKNCQFKELEGEWNQTKRRRKVAQRNSSVKPKAAKTKSEGKSNNKKKQTVKKAGKKRSSTAVISSGDMSQQDSLFGKQSPKESIFKISKTPLSKMFGGKKAISETTVQNEDNKKPLKIIKIVTKGTAEAQEVLKSIQKQKASGGKLLENLPSNCVQLIKLDTTSVPSPGVPGSSRSVSIKPSHEHSDSRENSNKSQANTGKKPPTGMYFAV